MSFSALTCVQAELRHRFKSRWKKHHDGSKFSVEQRAADVAWIRDAVWWLRRRGHCAPCAHFKDREHGAWVAEAERLRVMEEERDKALADYRFMVERAADQRLDGYRELGARAAAAENARDLAQAQLSLEQASKDQQLSDAEAARRGAESMRDLAVRVVDEMRVALEHCLAAMDRHDFGDTDHDLVVAADRALSEVMGIRSWRCGSLMEIGTAIASAEAQVRRVIECIQAPVFVDEREMICRVLRLPAPQTTDVEPLGLCDRCDEPVHRGEDRDIAGTMVCRGCYEEEEGGSDE